MDLERIRRKIVALENKNQVTFASISGSTRSLSHNGTEIVIDNGDAVCNGNVIAENLREDNEERLTACEIAIANMDDRYAKKEHTHFISDIINLQEILDQIMSSIGSGDSPNIKVGPFNINVNGGGGGSITGDYASKEVYDYVDDEEGKRTATIKASEGLKVNDVPVSMEGHTHLLNDIDNIEELDDLYADIDHNHDDKYATFASLDYKANVEHTHLLEDIDDIDTLDELYAAKDHDHTSTNITDKINEYDKGTVVDDTYLINNKDPAEYYPDISLLVEDDHVKLFFSGDNYSNQFISFNYKNQEYGPPPFSDNIGEWHYDAGENNMKLWFDHDVEVNDITVKIREETYVIHGMPPHEEITDMTSKSVITANAVKGYTESNFAPKVHTHVSEDITDKINNISFNNTVNKEWVLQEGTIFTKGSSPDGLEIRRSCTNDLSFNIYYNYDEASIQYSTMNSTIDFNGLKINKGSNGNAIIIIAPESVTETMTLFLTNITVDSEPKPNEKVTYKYITSSITTDMTSKEVITANAVKEYVDYQLANIESIPNLDHDHDDEYAPIDHTHSEYARAEHTHNSSDILDSIFGYTTSEYEIKVVPPFKVVGNEITIDTQYTQEGWYLPIRVRYVVNNLGTVIATDDSDYYNLSADGENVEKAWIKIEYRDNLPYISKPETIERLIITNIVPSNGFTQTFDDIELTINKGPTDMNSEKLIAASAVKGYTESNYASKDHTHDKFSSEYSGYTTKLDYTGFEFNGNGNIVRGSCNAFYLTDQSSKTLNINPDGITFTNISGAINRSLKIDEDGNLIFNGKKVLTEE